MPVRPRRDHTGWIIDFRVGDKRIRREISKKKCPTRRQAQALEQQLRQEAKKGLSRRRQKVTWIELAERYWDEHARHLNWSATVKTHLTVLSDAIGDHTPADDIDGDMVSAVFATWRDDLAPATLNRRLAVLRGLWYRATGIWGYRLEPIPWRLLRHNEPEPEPRDLLPEECERILAACSGHVRLAVELALLTGLRRASILSLRWEQVDRVRGVINAVGKGRGAGKANTVPITPGISELLDRIGSKDVGPIITYRGRPVRNIRTAWRRAKIKAGLPHVRFHDLRHTYAQGLLDTSHNLSLVQDALHHTSARTTRRYAQRRLEHIAQAMAEAERRRKS